MIAAVCSQAVLVCFNVSASAQDETTNAAVQILSYRDGKLLTQGSGARIGEDVIVTAAHLDYDADALVVAVGGGVEQTASVIVADRDKDLLLLRVSGLAGEPALLAVSPPPVNDTVVIRGFWAADEERQSPRLFGKKRPRFQPQVHASQNNASAIVYSEDASFLTARASAVGRGGYGAPVIDDCGGVSGVVVAQPGADIDDLWSHHTPSSQLTVVSVTAVAALAETASLSLNLADEPCTPATEAALRAAQAEKEAARLEAEDAEKRADEERKKREEAEREKEAEKQRADEAASEAEETREAADAFAEEAEENRIKIKEAEKERGLFLRAAAAAGAGLVIAAGLAVWLMRRRKVDKQIAEAALADATARYNDCLLKGETANGEPIAIKLSGGDLQHEADGVVLGRNPGQAQFVVGDDTVSRRHARISLIDGVLHIEDLDSTGGTKVNGQMLAPRTPAPLQSGDFIELGGAKLNFEVLED